jgi:threonyl-tRNA synthetase
LQGYSIHIDKSGDKLDKKIRNAQLESYNFIGVIGPKEVETETINLRKRDEQDPFGTFTIPEMLKMFSELTAPKSRKR